MTFLQRWCRRGGLERESVCSPCFAHLGSFFQRCFSSRIVPPAMFVGDSAAGTVVHGAMSDGSTVRLLGCRYRASSDG